jgi:general secretion pathway protein I
MIALAILSLVAVAFLRTQAGSVRLADESNQISLATLLAQEKLAEVESAGFPEPGKISGTGDETFPPLRWERIVSATEFLPLRKVLVRILWREGEKDRTLEMVTYLAQK